MKHARLNFVSTVEKHRFFLTELKKTTRSIVIRSATSAFLLGFTNCRKQRAPSRCFTTSLNPFFLCLVFLLSVSAVISWKFNILPKISSFPPPFFSPKHKWRRRRRSYRKFHGKSWRWRASLRGNEDVQRLTIENNREAARAERYRVQGSRHKNLWPIHKKKKKKKRRKEREERSDLQRSVPDASNQYPSRRTFRFARNYGRWKTLTSWNDLDTFDEFQAAELAIKLEPPLVLEQSLKIVFFEHLITRIYPESGLTKWLKWLEDN